jgi:serine/threonine-protein phosphatase 2B catalytic subunit
MDPLTDPLNNRVVKNLPPPPHRPLDSKLMFKGDKVNWSLMRDFLKKEGRVGLKEMMKLLDMAIAVFGTT